MSLFLLPSQISLLQFFVLGHKSLEISVSAHSHLDSYLQLARMRSLQLLILPSFLTFPFHLPRALGNGQIPPGGMLIAWGIRFNLPSPYFLGFFPQPLFMLLEAPYISIWDVSLTKEVCIDQLLLSLVLKLAGSCPGRSHFMGGSGT